MADDSAQSPQSPVDSTALNEIATNGALLNQNLSELTKAVGSLASIVLPVTNGGTGLDHSDPGGLLVGAADNTYSILDDVATGNALISGGVNTSPSWGKITPSHFSGVLPIANGGTAKSSFTAYSLICGGTTTTGALQSVVSVGTAGQFLRSNGAGALPTFQNYTFTDGIGGLFTFPDNDSYRIWLSSPFACTLTAFKTICDSGTCTATLINGGTTVQANSVSTSFVNSSISSALSVGGNLFITVSSNSSCVNFAFMIDFTRTL